MKVGNNFSYLFTIGFTVQLIVMLLIFSIGFITSLNNLERMEDNIKQHHNKVLLINQMHRSSRERLVIVWKASITDDSFERLELQDKLIENGSLFLSAKNRLMETELNTQEQLLLKGINESLKKPGIRTLNLMDRLIEGENSKDFFKTTNIPFERQDRVIHFLNEMAEKQKQIINKIRAQAHGEVTNTVIWTTVYIFAALVLGGLFAFLVLSRAHLIVKETNKAKNDLNTLNIHLEKRVEVRTHQLQYANECLEKLAKYDKLTGLPNRLLLFEKMESLYAMAKRNNNRLAVLFLDLDGFKAVNDTYGHDIGDFVLVEVAKLLKASVRDSDLVARLSGDEFIVVLNEVKENSSIESLAQKIIQHINQPLTNKNKKIHIGASIGICIYPDHANSIDLLFRYADIAMYQSKKNGKNSYRFHSDSMGGMS